MPFRITAITLAASTCLISATGAAQTIPDASDTAILRIAYEAVAAGLPDGRRVVAVNDPLLNVPAGQENDVRLGNRRLANGAGLSTVALDEVLTCRKSFDCSFKDDVVATVSLRIAWRTADSAVVWVATRYFLAPSEAQRELGRWFAWQAIALDEVTLARRTGHWIVTSVGVRSES